MKINSLYEKISNFMKISKHKHDLNTKRYEK